MWPWGDLLAREGGDREVCRQTRALVGPMANGGSEMGIGPRGRVEYDLFPRSVLW